MTAICYSQPTLSQSPDSNVRDGWNRELDSAVSRARERTGGRVLSAETRYVDGQPIHFVRILTKDGKVRRLRIDASSEKGAGPRRRR